MIFYVHTVESFYPGSFIYHLTILAIKKIELPQLIHSYKHNINALSLMNMKCIGNT